MFEIGFPELILIAIVGLLVIGPERLPEALRTLGLWLGRLRRSFTAVKTEIEREIGMDEVRRQLHNEAVMEEMRRIQRDVNHAIEQPDRRPQQGQAPEQQSAGKPAAEEPAAEEPAAEEPGPDLQEPRERTSGNEPSREPGDDRHV